MKNTIFKNAALSATTIALCLSLAACGGRSANPISVRDSADKEMSCVDIEDEMNELDRKARRLIGEESEKMGKNVALGVGGLFVFPLWFFMDLSDAERVEAQAMEDRMAHLKRVARKGGCDI